MAGATLTFKLEDAKRISDHLEELARRSASLKPLFESIGHAVVETTKERFKEEKDPQGVKWAPLSPAYAAEKGRQKILTKTGILHDSLTFRADPHEVEVGTNMVYAAIHQFGGEIVPKHGPYLRFTVGERHVRAKRAVMPQREFLGLSNDDREMIEGIVADYFDVSD